MKMKKWVALLLAVLMTVVQATVWAENLGIDDYNHLVVGNTTAFNGNFSTNMWGNNTADLDVEHLLFGYNLVLWEHDQGYFTVDPTVVTGIMVYDDDLGNRTYSLVLAEDLYYTDGTQITAWDYAFTVLLSVAEEIKAIGGNTDSFGAIQGMDAYKNGETDVLPGVRVTGDFMISFTIDAANRPFFYEMGLLRCLPLPIHVIAPGCSVKDDGQGIYLDKSAGTFTADALNRTMLDPQNGFVFNPKVTSGPYKLISFDGNTVEFEINEYYKGNAYGVVPTIPYLTYKTVSNETMMDQLAKGELDLINKVVNADSIMNGIELVGQDLARMQSYARVGLSMMSFNCEKATVRNASVRQAMAYCLDKDALVSSYVGGFGLRVDGYYGIGQWMYQVLTGAMEPPMEEPEEGATAAEKKAYEDALLAWEEITMENIPVYNLDISRANQLLDYDGWTLNREGNTYRAGVDDVRCAMIDGELVALDLQMIYPEGNKIAGALEETFIANLKQAGIQLTLVPVPMEKLLQQYYRFEERNCDMIYLATNFSEVFDPTLTYAPVDGINSNYSCLEDTQLYELALDMAMTEPGDILTYCQKWISFQEYWAQVLPAIPVYSNAYFDFHTPLLQDYFISATATWGQAVVEAYLGDPAIEDEEIIEDDEEMGEGGIIIID